MAAENGVHAGAQHAESLGVSCAVQAQPLRIHEGAAAVEAALVEKSLALVEGAQPSPEGVAGIPQLVPGFQGGVEGMSEPGLALQGPMAQVQAPGGLKPHEAAAPPTAHLLRGIGEFRVVAYEGKGGEGKPGALQPITPVV